MSDLDKEAKSLSSRVAGLAKRAKAGSIPDALRGQIDTLGIQIKEYADMRPKKLEEAYAQGRSEGLKEILGVIDATDDIVGHGRLAKTQEQMDSVYSGALATRKMISKIKATESEVK